MASSPWHVAATDFDAQAQMLTISMGFTAGSRFALPGVEGQHPVYDTAAKRHRHMNIFEHDYFLEVRVPRVKFLDGSVRQIEPRWAGKLPGFTLLYEALVLMLYQQMSFATATRLAGE